MCRTYQEYPYDTIPEPEDYPLNLQDQILIKCGLPIPIGKLQLEGWSAPLPWYLFECKKHGLVTNYRWGHSQRLVCPKCFDEECSNWRGGASGSEEVSIVGNAMRGPHFTLVDPSQDKEAPPT